MTASAALRLRLLILLGFLGLLVFFSLFAGYLAPYDPEAVNLSAAKLPPGGKYLMGTDWLGRCIWSRILAGAKSTVLSSLIIVGLSMLIGCLLGLISGYAGGIIDESIMRIVDVFLAFPGIVLSIAIAGMLGPGLINGILALAASGWPQYARLMRSCVLSLKQENYVKAALLNGQTGFSVLKRHIFPHALRPVIVTGTLHLSSAALGISGLSFLGLGSSGVEWGSMLSEGRSLMQTCPWVVLYPSLAIFLVTLIFNLLGERLRDILDPTIKPVPHGFFRRRQV